jgi:hypothetical protein
MRRLLVLCALALLAAAGCGGEDDPPVDGDDPVPPIATQPTGGTAPGVFNDEGVTGSYECGGQDITLNGAEADVHLTGACGTVVVNGDRVRLVVDDAAVIVVNGDDSTVSYGGDPEVTVNGDSDAEPVGG